MHDSHESAHQEMHSKTIFGFWCYLLTDFMMFATFFATYAVLKNGTYGGPTSHDIMNISRGLLLTLVFLATSMTSGLGGVSVHRSSRKGVLFWFFLTFLLGSIFLILQFQDWQQLIAANSGWERSAFLSSFFTILGMHAIHVVIALLWTLVLLTPTLFHPITDIDIRRITCLRMFWQFLNVVWLFVFTVVYLLGVV